MIVICKSELLAQAGLRYAIETDVADKLSDDALIEYIFDFCCVNKSEEVLLENERFWKEGDQEIDSILQHFPIFGETLSSQLKKNQRNRGASFAKIELNRGQSRKSNGGHFFERSVINALRYKLGDNYSVCKAKKVKGSKHTIDLIVTNHMTGRWQGLCLKNRTRERWSEERDNCVNFGAWFVTRETDLSVEAAQTMTMEWSTLVFVPNRITGKYNDCCNIYPISSLRKMLVTTLSNNEIKEAA